MGDVGSADRLNVALNEFKALRDEINQRATYCHTLINLNVLATGTVAGFALGHTTQPAITLIIPILNPVLGLLWLDHSFAIRGMGDYIEKYLRGVVNSYAESDGTLLGWEGHLDQAERHNKILRFLPLGAPIAILFAGLPVVALAFAATQNLTSWDWLLWSIGALLTLTFITMWLSFLLRPYAAARSTAIPNVGRA